MSWIVRSAAAVGALVAAPYLPLALLGVVAGAHGLSTGRRYDWFFLTSDLSMLASGICGALGFAGFTMYALLPVRQFVRRPWLKPMVVTALLGGVVGAVILVVPAITIAALDFESFHVVLSGLALLGVLLARYMTANPSIERTS